MACLNGKVVFYPPCMSEIPPTNSRGSIALSDGKGLRLEQLDNGNKKALIYSSDGHLVASLAHLNGQWVARRAGRTVELQLDSPFTLAGGLTVIVKSSSFSFSIANSKAGYRADTDWVTDTDRKSWSRERSATGGIRLARTDGGAAAGNRCQG